MESSKRVGRTIGVLLLLQGVGGVVGNFVLLAPLTRSPPGFLLTMAAHPAQVALAVLLGLLTAGAVALGIALAAYPLFRGYSARIALAFVSIATVCFVLVAVEGIALLSMLSLSQAQAAAPAGAFDMLAVALGAFRKWTHYTQLIAASGMLLVLYGALHRFALVPRAFTVPGLIGVLLQLAAFAMVLFGEPMRFLLIAPLGLVHLALTVWLLTRGFVERGALRPPLDRPA
jgi:hypothetical protein